MRPDFSLNNKLNNGIDDPSISHTLWKKWKVGMLCWKDMRHMAHGLLGRGGKERNIYKESSNGSVQTKTRQKMTKERKKRKIKPFDIFSP